MAEPKVAGDVARVFTSLVRSSIDDCAALEADCQVHR